MRSNSKNIDYTKEEARHRFEAALRGAFKTPHKPMKDIPPKRRKAQRGKTKRAKS